MDELEIKLLVLQACVVICAMTIGYIIRMVQDMREEED